MSVDVIIMGAGIGGAALAYFLSGEGLSVELVDKDYPGLGTSGRSAGLLTVQHWNPLDVGLAQATMRICRDLSGEEELLTQAGFLRATSREEDMRLMERRARMYRDLGSEAIVLDNADMAARFPDLDVSGLVCGLYTPGDSYVDAYDVTKTLFENARQRGVRIRMATPVEKVEKEASKVMGLRTSKGTLSAERVVVAAGPWTSSLFRESGLSLPLKAYRTQALSTAPVQGLPQLPMFHELPGGLYFRPDRGGLLLGDGTELEEADPAHYDTHADFSLHAQIATWLTSRAPALKDVRFSRGWAGLCVATPDRFPLVGPVEGVTGLYVMTGFNGMGAMRAPPLARALAETLLGRRPSLDLEPFRPDRLRDKADFPIREGFTLQGNEVED